MPNLGFETLCRIGPEAYKVTLTTEASGWKRCEQELIDAGIAVPLPHRAAWTDLSSAAATWFVSVRSAGGRCVGGFAAGVHPSRALPGHRVLRVERFGPAQTDAARRAGLTALAELARQDRSILRVDLEVFARETAVRAGASEAASALGFRRRGRCRCYSRTIAVDLRPTLPEIFASLSATARRHTRAVDKHPVGVRTIDEPTFAARLAELMRETMARTGGRVPPLDWERTIRFCTRHPELARLVGLFGTDAAGPPALLAFVLGYHHGDHAQYVTAASTRRTTLRMPLAYGPAWDLMCWAKQHGAAWFDFGGVTGGTHADPQDPLGGISDFKRYFAKEVLQVGEDWVLAPRPLQAALARSVSAGYSLLVRLRSAGMRRWRRPASPLSNRAGR